MTVTTSPTYPHAIAHSTLRSQHGHEIEAAESAAKAKVAKMGEALMEDRRQCGRYLHTSKE